LEDLGLVGDLAVVAAAALVGGFLAARLGLPPIVGYLLAGVAVGPATPGLTADPEVASELAEIGVVLLMFGVGLHFSLRDLLAVRAIAVPGAVAQITVATTLAATASMLWGWTPGEALVLGLAVSVASTIVLIRAMEERGQLDSVQGHIAIGWLIIEDIFTVLVLVMLPALADPLGGRPPEGGEGPLIEFGLAVGKAAAFIALMLILGPRLIPPFLVQVSQTRSRELFTLSVLAIALGIAVGSSELFGVSLALGAFVAGVIINQSDVSYRAGEDALPMRDAFAVLFFVSVGMLFEPKALVEMPLEIAAVLVIVIVGKGLAAFAIVAAFRYPRRVALTVSAGLAQIGEFSFIVVALAESLELVPEDGMNLVLAGALLSITLNPLVFRAADWLEGRLKEQGRFEGEERLAAVASGIEPMARHVVVCGSNDAARVVIGSVRERFKLLVITEDAIAARRLRADGITCLLGDASRESVLRQASVEAAIVLVVTLDDVRHAEAIIREAKQIDDRLDVIARGSGGETRVLAEAGAYQVIDPELEGGLELLTHTLHRLGVSSMEVQAILRGWRRRLTGGG
jgi:CPA2 family monovalent cation:H+ antiporter-2